MKRLVLVRHGESRWNAEGRIQGQRCAGLSDVGHAQSRVAAAALAAAYPDAQLACSDLQRAVETAAPFEQELGRVARHDAALRERSFGAWEGKQHVEVAEHDPARWARWLSGEDLIAEVGGESASQLADRVVTAFVDLLATTPTDGVTIAVSHGGSIHHGVHRWLGLARRTLGGVANTGVAEVISWEAPPVGDDPAARDTRSERVALDRWNEVAHLPVELRTAWTPPRDRAAASPAGR